MAITFPEERYLLHWINKEIPAYLDKCGNYETFVKNMPSACASGNWKIIAFAMAKERWGVAEIEHIPR